LFTTTKQISLSDVIVTYRSKRNESRYASSYFYHWFVTIEEWFYYDDLKTTTIINKLVLKRHNN